MLSKRKALIGYGVYTLGKPLAKRKLKQQVSSKRAKIVGGIAAAVAAAGATMGGIAFWRRRRSGGAESTEG